MSKFHFVGLPHTVSNNYFLGCAFTGHIIRLAKGLSERGHDVIHYGNPGAEVAGRHIDVTMQPYVDRVIGDYKNEEHTTMYADKHPSTLDARSFHVSVAGEIRKRVEKDDYIILSYGTYIPLLMEFIEDLHSLPVFIVESTIGYLDSWKAPYKVFESESVRSWNRSQWNQNFRLHQQNTPADPLPGYAVHECTPQFNDDTIPTFCDPDLFEYTEEKEDYFLYLGRIIPSKGIDIAVNVCERLGEKLIVAGHGDLEKSIGRAAPDNVEFVGYAMPEKRKELMAKAKGGFVCTYYSEHGGNVIHEYGLSGTPVICTNWGSFTHSVIHNKTGYLIQDESEAVWAAQNIGKIAPWRCRKWQMNYTIDRVVPRFERYFERIRYNWYGWNGEHYEVADLNYREMIHPDNMDYDIDLEYIAQK